MAGYFQIQIQKDEQKQKRRRLKLYICGGSCELCYRATWYATNGESYEMKSPHKKHRRATKIQTSKE